MLRRLSIAAAAASIGLLVAASPAHAFDCIRVSSSLQGLMNSTKSGNWLLIDFSTPAATTASYATIGVTLLPAEASCFTSAYAASGQPRFFAIGIGVAGSNGVLAHLNKNTNVLSNGRGIDHLDDSPILPAIDAAAAACFFTT